MATYAIGDLQGCYTTLQLLLTQIAFNPKYDRLWFVGDLVNRGADSLACLRFVKGLGNAAVTVLGNHDLHLLAVAEGLTKTNESLQPILEATDREELLFWLRQQKLLHVEGANAMVHAGLLPEWDIAQAQQLAHEVETALRSAGYRNFLLNMYGDQPDRWNDRLSGTARLRLIINAMTRMRMLTREGALDLTYKGEVENAPHTLLPWFEFMLQTRSEKPRLITGHWSALGLRIGDNFVCLDTGCVWGRQLSAMRLEDSRIFQIASTEPAPAAGRD